MIFLKKYIETVYFEKKNKQKKNSRRRGGSRISGREVGGGVVCIKVWGFALLILSNLMKYPMKMK